MEALRILYKSRKLEAYQSILSYTLPPGIYYNFVCRDISDISDFRNSNHKENAPTIPELKELIKKSPERSKYKNMLTVFQRRIGNFSRKAQAHNYYTSHEFKKKYKTMLGQRLQHAINWKELLHQEKLKNVPSLQDKLAKLEKEREERLKNSAGWARMLNRDIKQVKNQIVAFDRKINAQEKLANEYRRNSFNRRFKEIKKSHKSSKPKRKQSF